MAQRIEYSSCLKKVVFLVPGSGVESHLYNLRLFRSSLANAFASCSNLAIVNILLDTPHMLGA